jgi:uncharacterized alkaline shock family protein YloU
MAEEIPGNLHVANDVLADIVGNAAMQCYGVVGMSSTSAIDGIIDLLPASRLRKGVVITPNEEGIAVELHVVIEHGTNIAAVSQNLVDAVQFALKEYACVNVSTIDVHVSDVLVRK